MKNLITGIACLIVLSVFLVQITGFQVTHSKILYAETVVNAAVETARQDGCFTAANVDSLKLKLAKRLGCDASEISVEGPSSPAARGTVFSYKVSYPLKNILGAATLLGISDDENSLVNTISGSAASEYIGR